MFKARDTENPSLYCTGVDWDGAVCYTLNLKRFYVGLPD